MRNRAFRRHHRARMVARAREIQLRWCLHPDPIDEQELHVAASKVADNLALCSCWMCGNPRRYYTFVEEALTVQERRALLDYQDQLDEIEG